MEIELFPKQEQFFDCENRINLYIGGIQSAKTTTGALKMLVKGILEYRDPLDTFIIFADTYKTLYQATLPKFLSYAKPYGKMNKQSGEFRTHWGSTVYCRTATEPESMEGITNVRRIWGDEVGKVSRYFFENAMGRAAFKECPIDATTTPYSMNWLSQLYRDAKDGKRPDVDLVHCRSIDSPYFPKAEYERQKRILDPRRFLLKYEGEFGVMEGLVYDHYQKTLVKSHLLPSGTIYYAGIDWGYRDPFALVLRAITPGGIHYRVGEYIKTNLTISEIVNVVKGYNGIYKFKGVPCDPSQPAHIEELCRHGIPAYAADNDIRFGIDTHYALMKNEQYFIFEDANPIGVDEYSSYHYPEEIELKTDESQKERMTIPVDQNNHSLDADRYLSIELAKTTGQKITPKTPHDGSTRPRDIAKRLEWLKKGGSSRSAQ